MAGTIHIMEITETTADTQAANQCLRVTGRHTLTGIMEDLLKIMEYRTAEGKEIRI
jgi:hypothetical protein